MAKLPQLIATLAKFDTRGEGAVENLTRELRKASLISPGKRGAGAPAMTVSDVANVILGTVTRLSKDAPFAVERLRNAVMVGAWKGAADLVAKLADTGLVEACRNADGALHAGLFLEEVLRRFARDGVILNAKGKPAFADVTLKIKDPVTGLGSVSFVFNADAKGTFEIQFVDQDPHRERGLTIQIANEVPEDVLYEFSQLLKDGGSETGN